MNLPAASDGVLNPKLYNKLEAKTNSIIIFSVSDSKLKYMG